ncbi:hypothetical protein D3C80_1614370 [compost metagenome]
MAIDAGFAFGYRLVMHLRRHGFLRGEVHILEVVAVTALLRIVGLHARPLVAGHRQPVLVKLLRRIDQAERLGVQFLAGLQFAQHFRCPLVRHVAIRASGAHAAAVVVMHRTHVFLIHVFAHFVAADTKLLGIRRFHTGIKTAPEDNPGAKAQ